ncbi:hypothetical protein HG536_0H01040 [Torulaspora globosa]|uniref:Uncharacterized protein n=1 Tax=Torulaspora globosa TaxID=48254 RepID=A0A7G3ZMJ3_9SACH|nr:uncharacterized protein HG536_0H01040 [Torulaspora globosa]QLL34729.1 hypothetical protein HG536_0H01040 [Torulaspora globosa]
MHFPFKTKNHLKRFSNNTSTDPHLRTTTFHGGDPISGPSLKVKWKSSLCLLKDRIHKAHQTTPFFAVSHTWPGTDVALYGSETCSYQHHHRNHDLDLHQCEKLTKRMSSKKENVKWLSKSISKRLSSHFNRTIKSKKSRKISTSNGSSLDW